MYVLIIALLVATSLLLALAGWRRESKGLIAGGGALLLGTALFFAFLSFWGEYLWFDALGYPQRFWTRVLAQGGLMLGAALGAGLVTWLLLRAIPGLPRPARLLPATLASIYGLLRGAAAWEPVLLFFNSEAAGKLDPILGRDVSFYLFTMPVLELVHGLGIGVALLTFGGLLLGSIDFGERERPSERDAARLIARWSRSERGRRLLHGAAWPLGFLAFVIAYGLWLERFELLLSTGGVVHGAGYTDVHVRLPLLTFTAGLSLVVGLVLWIAPLRRRLGERFPRRKLARPLYTYAALFGALLAVAILGLGLAPALVQWLRVEPNEITLERPFIEHNIAFTRNAFGLDEIEEREYPAEDTLTRAETQRNQGVLDEVRLWDWRALDAVYRQFQEIRLYYEFVDVDIDRYTIDGRYREVMVSAREMETDNLPAQSQTFVNRRFKYTHGYGLTMAPVNEFTEEGLPELLIRDIPPKWEYPSLAVERPEIYFGELTDEHVFVDTEEQEFDYPRGEQNVYTRYEGEGGVGIGSFFRRFLFGWKLDGTRLLLSGYPREGSRVLLYRDVRERVGRVAPFLTLDDDAYVALVDGRLKWIVDAYTRSSRYPYAEPYDARERIELKAQGSAIERLSVPALHGRNYVRNAVKAVVDAYDGSVELYVFEENDPIVKAWRGAFPEIFAAREEMPEALEAHVRYPADLLLVQGLVYAKYHMTDPEVFYNQEDLWVRATEKYYGGVEPVSPYYVMWKPPEEQDVEFTLILPFTPKNRQVAIGWIAGLCDGENYGRFLAYKFPKEKRVLGPQQVETKIDQDRFLSGQLSLWDQRGSRVIRGNVLAIPIAETVLYVEPIYLQAETAAYPELRLVVVMHNDRLSYAESFDEALAGLFEEDRPELPDEGAAAPTRPKRIDEASAAFDDYMRATGEGRFEDAAAALERLRRALGALEDEQDPEAEAPAAAGR